LKRCSNLPKNLKKPGLPSLYNESLGTVSESYQYDRIEDRDKPKMNGGNVRGSSRRGGHYRSDKKAACSSAGVPAGNDGYLFLRFRQHTINPTIHVPFLSIISVYATLVRPEDEDAPHFIVSSLILLCAFAAPAQNSRSTTEPQSGRRWSGSRSVNHHD